MERAEKLSAQAASQPGNPTYSLKYDPEILHAPQPFGRKNFFFRVFMQRMEGTVWNRMFSFRVRHAVHRGGYLQQGYTDLYSSPHVWDTPWSREDADIKYLAASSVDLDWYKLPEFAGWTHEQVHEAVLQHCQDNAIPTPSVIVDTGRGSLLIWLFNRITTAQIMKRYRQTNSALIERFKSFGADPACVNPRMWRVIGSWNSKSMRRVSIAWTNLGENGKVAGYRFDDLANAVLEMKRTQQRAVYDQIEENRGKAKRRREEAKRPTSPKVVALDAHRMPVQQDKERYNWLAEAEKDLVKLIREKHNGKLSRGERDIFLFHLGCLIGQIYKADRWWPKLQAYAQEFAGEDERFLLRQFPHYMSSLRKRVQQTTDGKRSRTPDGNQVSRVYTYSKARILRELNITEEDMRRYGLSALVTDRIREERKYERRKEARRNAGATPRAVFEATSISRAKPWEALGISRATWYRRGGNDAADTVRQVCPTL